MPTNAVRRHKVDTGGPWGTGLLLLGVAAIAQGIGYITTDPAALPPALRSIGLPMSLCGALWVLAGGYAITKALTPPQRHLDVWPLVAVTLAWALAYGLQWVVLAIDGDFTRDWSSSLAWGSLAVLIICWGRCINPPVRKEGPPPDGATSA